MKMRVTNPDDIRVELTVEMSLREWKLVQKDLSARAPSWKLGSAIVDMILKAEKEFYPTETDFMETRCTGRLCDAED